MNLKFVKILIIFSLYFSNSLNAEIVKKIEIKGNDRISNDTIKLFSEVKLNDNLSKKNINDVLKNFIIQIFSKKYI